MKLDSFIVLPALSVLLLSNSETKLSISTMKGFLLAFCLVLFTQSLVMSSRFIVFDFKAHCVIMFDAERFGSAKILSYLLCSRR